MTAAASSDLESACFRPYEARADCLFDWQGMLLTPVLGALRSLLAVLMSCSRGLALLQHHSAECIALMAALDPAEAGSSTQGAQSPSG